MTPRELSSTYRSQIITRRWLATMVDFVALLVVCGVASALVRPEGMAGGAFVLLGVPFIYYLVLEATFGRTLGKFVTGLAVIDESGAAPSVAAVSVRTLTRYLEVNPFLFGGIPAGIIAERSKSRQRWGDMLADTYVVFSRDLPKLQRPAAAPAAT